MKMEAEITQGELKALVRYDPDTGCFHHLVARKNVSVGDVAGGLDMEGYVRLRLNGRRYKAHRLAIFYMTGKWPKAVDHKNKIEAITDGATSGHAPLLKTTRILGLAQKISQAAQACTGMGARRSG